jgi:hypothetical protein
MSKSTAYEILLDAGYTFREIDEVCTRKGIDIGTLATRELETLDRPLTYQYA